MIAINILTAQGYLSFTPSPDGKAVLVEYRPTPGEWETVALPGLEEAILAIVQQALGGSGGTTPTPPAEGDWLGIPPAQNAEYVAAIKANLQARGVDLSGPCGAYQVVENVAWGLRNSGCGTFFKDYGNMCANRSTDVVAYKDLEQGTCRIVDVLGDAGGENTPNWLEKQDPEEITRWMPAEHPDAVREVNPPTRSTTPPARKK